MTDTLDDLLELWAKAAQQASLDGPIENDTVLLASDWEIYGDEYMAQARAIHDATTGAGLAVMPVEATDKMADAWASLAFGRLKARISDDRLDGPGIIEGAKESYQAMLDASPYRVTPDDR